MLLIYAFSLRHAKAALPGSTAMFHDARLFSPLFLFALFAGRRFDRHVTFSLFDAPTATPPIRSDTWRSGDY